MAASLLPGLGWITTTIVPSDHYSSNTYSGNVATLCQVAGGNWTPLGNPGYAWLDLTKDYPVRAATIEAGDQVQPTTVFWNLDYSLNDSTWTTAVHDILNFTQKTFYFTQQAVARYWRLGPVSGTGHYSLGVIALFADMAIRG